MKQACCRHPRASRGVGALIEIVIVAVIILAAASLYLGFVRGGSGMDALDGNAGDKRSIPGRAAQQAESLACRQNLRQLRTLIDMARSEDEAVAFPASLDAIPEAFSLSSCPVGGEEYRYDPATGKVQCKHPGHELY